MTEISLRWYPYLWLANTNWIGTILLWDLQIDTEVVYEHIWCQVKISEIYELHFSVNLWRRSIKFLYFLRLTIKYIENYISPRFLWDSQLEILQNSIEHKKYDM